MDGIDWGVMLVHEDTHARTVAGKGLIGIGRIGSVVAVVGLAIKHMLLKVPVAEFLGGAGLIGGLLAVIHHLTVVIVLHDKGAPDEGEVEVAGYLGLTARRDGRYAVVEGVQRNGAQLGAGSIDNFDLLGIADLTDGQRAAAVYDVLIVDRELLERAGIKYLDISGELGVQRQQVDGFTGGQGYVVALTIDNELHHVGAAWRIGHEGMVIVGFARGKACACQ